MNKRAHRIIFSRRHGHYVAVAECACAQGKTAGQTTIAGGQGTGLGGFLAPFFTPLFLPFVGVLLSGAGLVGAAWSQALPAQPLPVQPLPVLASNALPQGTSTAQGAIAISQSSSANAASMSINQTTSKAVINWQSFDIGSNAKVNVIQPNAQAVLLNRVVGATTPSQILGQLSANGQVVVINPSGVVVGKDGSVSASSFTASTLGITDANFMAGNGQYERNGSTAGVVNLGSIKTTGGYVALLGASVSNEGKIQTQGGTAYMAAAERITIPVSGSGRIKLELAPASINTTVTNSQSGTLVTEGGQVYMQAAALNNAVASIFQNGTIDSSGVQGGAVHLLTDGGTIKVSGSITANSANSTNSANTNSNSSGVGSKGGDIIIGRDAETGLLAQSTDVSGAQLESNKGFVETSGDVLKVDGISVKAGEWLLDPYNITIAASTPSGTAYASSYTSAADSVILASDISANLTAGTSVTLATGAGGASLGNINVNANIAKTGGGAATLTLRAHNDIVVAANTTITSTTGALNVVFNSDFDASGVGGIVMNSGSGITSLGGSITMGGGTGGAGGGYAFGGSTTAHGIQLNGAALSSGTGNITLLGTSASSGANAFGVMLTGAATITTTSGTVNVTGYGNGTGQYGYGIYMDAAANKITTGMGNVTLTGYGSNQSSSDSLGMQIRSAGAVTTSGGNIVATGTSRGAAGNANLGIMFAGSGSFIAGGLGLSP